MRPTIVKRRKHNPFFRIEIIGVHDTHAMHTRIGGSPILP
jgi:hypothetical protein